MLLNKVQDEADLSEFLRIPPEEINRIVRESPEAVIDIIVMTMQALCTKLNLSKQDTEVCVKKVRTRDMGYLWENMKKIDVQASQAALTQIQAELTNAQAELANTKKELDGTKAELTDVKMKAQNADARIEYLEALLEEHGIKIAED